MSSFFGKLSRKKTKSTKDDSDLFSTKEELTNAIEEENDLGKVKTLLGQHPKLLR